MGVIYFDNASTRKPTEGSACVFSGAQREMWGNPHSFAPKEIDSSAVIDEARDSFANALMCDPENIFFTSCASESNAQIIETALLYGARIGKKHIVTTAIEHPSIMLHMKHLESLGYEISYALPNKNGNVPFAHVASLIRDDTFFVSVMLVNNETGACQSAETMAQYCRKKGILFHTDATQGAGFPHVSFLRASCIDFVSMSGHKVGAGLGAGLLYMSDHAMELTHLDTPTPIIFGHQQNGARGGTANVPAILAFAREYPLYRKGIGKKLKKIEILEQDLLEKLSEKTKFKLNCSEHRKPGILSIRFDSLQADPLVTYCRMNGIAISGGSACRTGSPEPSYVLTAMGLSREEASKTIRVSLCEESTYDEIEKFVNVIAEFSDISHKCCP